MSTFPCAIHPAALPSYSEKGGGGKGRFIFAKVSFFSGEEKNLADGGRRKREGDGEIPLPLPPPPDSGEFEWLLSPSLFFPLLLPGKNQVKRSFFPFFFSREEHRDRISFQDRDGQSVKDRELGFSYAYIQRRTRKKGLLTCL